MVIKTLWIFLIDCRPITTLNKYGMHWKSSLADAVYVAPVWRIVKMLCELSLGGNYHSQMLEHYQRILLFKQLNAWLLSFPSVTRDYSFPLLCRWRHLLFSPYWLPFNWLSLITIEPCIYAMVKSTNNHYSPLKPGILHYVFLLLLVTLKLCNLSLYLLFKNQLEPLILTWTSPAVLLSGGLIIQNYRGLLTNCCYS